MKLERITFPEPRFDPRSVKGADNVRKHYTVAEGYDIDFDVATGIVKIFHPSRGRHNCVHVSCAIEFRELAADAVPAEAPKPQSVLVKKAEGTYELKRPADVVEIDPTTLDDGAPLVIPPRKRGRPRKVA